MSIASALAPLPIRALNPLDDKYYTSTVWPTHAGIVATPEAALGISAVWACVRLLSETVAGLPLNIYSRQPDGGRQRDTQHPIYTLLHNQPNRRQTSFEFRQMLMAHCLLRGNGYALIVPGPRGPVDRLRPLHPDAVTVKKVDDDNDIYEVRQATGRPTIYNDSDIFHLRGLTLDGHTGMSVVSYMRETIGLALATEQHGSRVFSQDASPRGVLTHPGKLSKEAKEHLKAEWADQHAGLQNSHSTAVLQEGMKWQQVGMTNEDAQYLATREFGIEDIARWFGVPLHMISSTTKATSWGSGIAQLSQGFVDYSLMPWLKRWEQAIARDLLIATAYYYAEFNVDGLLRGDPLTRAQALQTQRQNGIVNADEWREVENRNPLPDGEGQVYLVPANMTTVEKLTAPTPEPPAPQPPPAAPALPPPAANGHYLGLLEESATRVMNRETLALGRAAKREVGGWDEAVRAFYKEHASYVASTLRMPMAQAERWCSEQEAMVLAGGPAVLRDWEATRVGALVALALGGDE